MKTHTYHSFLECLIDRSSKILLFFLTTAFLCPSFGENRVVELHRSHQVDLSVVLRVGQHLILRTSPVPISAYHWDVNILDADVVKKLGDPRLEGGIRSEKLGAPFLTRFDFVATKTGKTDLVFSFFAGAKSPGFQEADSFIVHVMVQ